MGMFSNGKCSEEGVVPLVLTLTSQQLLSSLELK